MFRYTNKSRRISVPWSKWTLLISLVNVSLLIILSPTNYANDNIALLEAGFNRDIEKNTAILLEQEKETEVYLAIKTLLDKEAANDLLPEVEAANPAYKLFIQFKADNVSRPSKNHKKLLKYE